MVSSQLLMRKMPLLYFSTKLKNEYYKAFPVVKINKKYNNM